MNRSSFFNLPWLRYLRLIFSLLGIGFLSSGVITLIAANLDYLLDLQKIYALQVVVLLSVGLGIYYFLRESRKGDKNAFKPITSSFFFLALVLIGGLFALIGQTYQTGADAWQLFAIWSLCQLPFLFIVPNVAAALLLITTTNIALTLFQVDTSFYDGISFYTDRVFFHGSWLLVLVNFIFLLIAEYYSEKLHDQHWRILPKVLLVLTFASLF